jgi:hypothetical protein
VRVFSAAYFRQACTEDGHARAGHGRGVPFAGTPFEGRADPGLLDGPGGAVSGDAPAIDSGIDADVAVIA